MEAKIIITIKIQSIVDLGEVLSVIDETQKNHPYAIEVRIEVSG